MAEGMVGKMITAQQVQDAWIWWDYLREAPSPIGSSDFERHNSRVREARLEAERIRDEFDKQKDQTP